MTNRPKDIGTRGETAVVRAAQTRGFPNADRITLGGRHGDRSDVRLTIGLTAGVVIQVKAGTLGKNASEQQITTWLEQTEKQRLAAGAALAFLVTQRSGVGHTNAHRWWAHMRLTDLAHLIDPGARTPDHLADRPVRMVFDAALELLRVNGWGDPLIRPATEAST
jgi:hypothetical protein